MMWGMKSRNDRTAAFHQLHGAGCFVMSNSWDIGSARALEQMGFPALATTSAGAAWTVGREDNGMTLDQALDHLRETGVAGLSIEDATGDEADPLYDFELAVDRMRAARQAIDESGTGVLLTGRSEGFVC